MHSQNALKRLLFLFFLSAALAAAEPCRAVTFQIIYSDGPNEGFNDSSPYGNTTQTLGEARRSAFLRATSRLGSRLSGSQTVRVDAKFVIFPECRSVALPSTFTVGTAKISAYFYHSSRWDLELDRQGNQINPPAQGTAYPPALYKQIFRNPSGQDTDIFIEFSKCAPYYYGSGTPPPYEIGFTKVATHEIIHGLGFIEHVESNGGFPDISLTLTGRLNGQPFSGTAIITSRTIYDEQLYSEAEDDTLVNIPAADRARAVRSGTGLLWDGKDGGRNSCSYGQRMAELKSASAKSSDGKPRLHAPSSYDKGSSISHVHSDAQDIMEAMFPAPDNMDLTLGMLKDIGWGVSASGFPRSCEPTGITVTSAPPLVTTERGGEAKFSVKLDSRPSSSVTIPVTSSDPAEGTVSLPQGRLTFTASNWNIPQEVTVVGVDDGICDGEETYQINIGDAQSGDRFYNGFTPTPSILSATNNPSSTLSINNSSAEEGDGSIDFTVNLASPQNRQVTVQYEIADGTATAGSDYISRPVTTITFAPCETQKSISVDLTDDSTNEQDETFSVTLKNPTNAGLDQNRNVATATIKNDDGTAAVPTTPVISVNSPGVTEGHSGTENLAFTVSLDAQSSSTVTVDYEDSGNGTATEGADYAAITKRTLTFQPGETSKTVSVSVRGDRRDEPNETVILTFSSPANATLSGGGTTLDATGTITDDDSAPVISVNSPGVTEGHSGTQNLAFTVSLDAQSSSTVTVDYEDSGNGTATEGADYAAITKRTLTFQPGETSKTVSVSVRGDRRDEPNETVILTFSSPANATLSGGGSTLDATGTITDDDPTTVTLAINNSNAIPEAGGVKTLTISLGRALVSPETLRVPLSLEGQATPGRDYLLDCQNPPAGVACQNINSNAATVTFTGGSSSAQTVTLTLSAVDDNEDEGTGETVEITIPGTISGTNLGGGASGTGSLSFSITDDDTSTVPTISVDAGAAVTEGAAASFTIRSNPPPAGALTVNLSVSQSGSFAGQGNLGEKQIGVNELTTPYSVTTGGNSTDEPDGFVTVTIDPGNGYTVSGTGSSDRAAVRDDDPTTITISSTPPGNINEDGGTKSVTVTLGRRLVTGERITVPLIFGGTATHGSDYTLAGTDRTGISYSGLDSGNTPGVTFTGGAGSSLTAEVVITASPDRADEGAGETVTVRLGTSMLTGLDSARESGSVNFSIIDNDNPPLTPPPPPNPPNTESGSSAGGCALAAAGETSLRTSGALNIFASALFVLFMFYGKSRKPSI